MVLQHLHKPTKILTYFSNLLSQDGVIITTLVNTDRSHWPTKRYLAAVRDNPFSPFDESVTDRSFQGLGIHLTNST
ncbi:MAG: hypothetical protein WBA13_03425 [Microcoleaceae cyanobacterium]